MDYVGGPRGVISTGRTHVCRWSNQPHSDAGLALYVVRGSASPVRLLAPKRRRGRCGSQRGATISTGNIPRLDQTRGFPFAKAMA